MSEETTGLMEGQREARLEVLLAYVHETRAEILARIEARTQVLAAKVVLLSAVVVYMLGRPGPGEGATAGGQNGWLALFLPAAALLFDCIYVSHHMSVYRLGDYIAHVLEPRIAELTGLPRGELWLSLIRGKGHLLPDPLSLDHGSGQTLMCYLKRFSRKGANWARADTGTMLKTLYRVGVHGMTLLVLVISFLQACASWRLWVLCWLPVFALYTAGFVVTYCLHGLPAPLEADGADKSDS